MSENRDWTYYRYDWSMGKEPVNFFRRWRGIVDRLDRQTATWDRLDSDVLSRDIENGEAYLDETTRTEIEAAIGSRLPA